MESGARTRALRARRLQPSTRRFLRHLGEMLIAMMLGMMVLGGLATAIFAVGGSSLSDSPIAVRAGVMGFNMTVAMVAWMQYRGHPIARSAEMAASMLVPTAAAIGLHAMGAIESDAVLAVQHVVMIPAMVAVMWWRREHYAHGR